MKFGKLSTADICGSPVKPSKGSTGCGQSLKYGNQIYHYRSPHFIPKDKPAILMYEGNYCGRVNGDKEYLIVAFNGKNFTVLEHHYPGEAKRAMERFKGLTNEEAIALVQGEWDERQREYDAAPKCKCGRLILRFETEQRDDECIACFEKRTGKNKKKGKSDE
jgi:hypothetical protein